MTEPDLSRLPDDDDLREQAERLVVDGLDFEERFRKLINNPLTVAALLYDPELASTTRQALDRWEKVLPYLRGTKPAVVDVWLSGELYSGHEPIHAVFTELDALNGMLEDLGSDIKSAIGDMANDFEADWRDAYAALESAFEAADEMTSYDPDDFAEDEDEDDEDEEEEDDEDEEEEDDEA